MYNGIGVSTPRGTGTNGYVQRNLSFKKLPSKPVNKNNDILKAKVFKEPNKEILIHEMKRKIESELFNLKLKLIKEKKFTNIEIEEKIKKERNERFLSLEKNEKEKLEEEKKKN
eukprot:EC821918.1.p1 GENE.EC821918.1~~EC821918.1.p1  ORF type:complete len:114 (+),score=59.40 EC821918.1:45-386(+)